MTDVKVSMEAASGLERRLRVEIPAASVEEQVEGRLKTVGASARLKGFRPGKVPAQVIRQRFGSMVRQEVVQELVRTHCSEAIAGKELRPAVSPRIELGTVEQGRDVVFTAVFEVYPDIKVTGAEGLTLEKPEIAVAEADLDRTIELLRSQRADWIPVERKAATGDRVVIDFSGTREGAPIEGGKGEKVSVAIGEGRMVAGFEEALVGLASGADKTFQVTFPADYHDARLRGAQVSFDVHVHQVLERKLPEVNAEFIRGFDIASGELAEFRQLVRENLEREASAKVQSELRRQVLEGLLSANPVEVPLSMISQEAASLQAEAMRNLGVSDVKDAPPLSAYEDVARRRVRLGLIMSALIHEKGLKIDREKVDQKLEELCRPYDRPEEVRKLYLQSAELMAQVENSVMEEQVMGWLIERATVIPKPVAFDALMRS